MSIDTKHPDYLDHIDDWHLLLDSYAGERQVKAAGVKYLPPTSGMELDGMSSETQLGKKAYNAYRTRSTFPDFVKSAVSTMVGVMHSDAARIEVPDKLMPMLKNATAEGESIDALLRRINEAQLLTGRIGLLVEIPNNMLINEVVPFISTYSAMRIINWSLGVHEQKQKLELVVLDETDIVQNLNFSWDVIINYRVLIRDQENNRYSVAVVDDQNINMAGVDFIQPAVAGRQLDLIPFIFINSTDLVSSIDTPPLLSLANLGMTVYRSEADYRQALFQQGQDTLVIIGVEEGDTDIRVGAGATLVLPHNADAKYIGIGSAGLGELRAALENDKQDAAQKGAQLLNNIGSNTESGEALKIRVAASTANLVSIARTGAAGLESALRIAAIWIGADPDEVIVEPNLEFSEQTLGGKELLELMQAKAMGAPISQESIHRIMQQRDLTEFDFDIENEKIEEEGSVGFEDGQTNLDQ